MRLVELLQSVGREAHAAASRLLTWNRTCNETGSIFEGAFAAVEPLVRYANIFGEAVAVPGASGCTQCRAAGFSGSFANSRVCSKKCPCGRNAAACGLVWDFQAGRETGKEDVSRHIAHTGTFLGTGLYQFRDLLYWCTLSALQR